MTAVDIDSSPRRGITRSQALGWFALGLVVALALQALWVQNLGGRWDALLATGDDGVLRPVIEQQLGDIRVFPNGGHDGAVSYVVALDPLGTEFGELRHDSGLRWRRILHPLIAGAGGLVEGKALLVSLTLVAAAGFGLAVAAAADLMALAGLRRWTVMGVLLNPGLWLGVILITPDALAAGLGLSAIAAFARNRMRTTVVLLVLMVLAKDQYALVALGLAACAFVTGRRRWAGWIAGAPIAVIGAWSLYVASAVGGLTETNASIGAPFAGMLKGIEQFGYLAADERLMLILAYTMLVGALVVAIRTRRRLLRYVAVPWLLAAPLLSRWVWQTGNNALRVLAPLGFMAIIGLEDWLQSVKEAEQPSRDEVSLKG